MMVSRNTPGQIEAIHDTQKSLSLVKIGNNKYCVHHKVQFLNESKILNLFHPRRTNFASAKSSSDSLAHKLGKNKGYLDVINAQLKKEIKSGRMRILSKQEMSELQYEVHNFSHLNVAYNLDSTSTLVRLISDLSRPLLADKTTTLSLELKSPNNSLGNMLESIIGWRLHAHTAALDISKCYWQISVNKLYSLLTMHIWYLNPKEQKDLIIIIDLAMQFGYRAASAVIEAIIHKYILNGLFTAISIYVVTVLRFADNLPLSFPEKPCSQQ